MKFVSFFLLLMMGLMVNLSAQCTTTLRFDLSETLSAVVNNQGDKTECNKICDPTNCDPADCKKITNCKVSECKTKGSAQVEAPEANQNEIVAIAEQKVVVKKE